MNLKYIPALLLYICILTGCKDDPVDPTCENYSVRLGPFYLAQSSKNLFPYSDTDSTLVFRNAVDEELVMTRSFSLQDTLGFSIPGECPFDTTIEVPYLITIDQMSVTFINDSLDLSAQFSFQASYRADKAEVTGQSDIASLHFQKLIPGNSVSVSSILTYKSGEVLLYLNRYFDSITLGSKTFTEVYSNFTIPQNPPAYMIYMNYDLGMVGFEDTAQGDLWVLDRIE